MKKLLYKLSTLLALMIIVAGCRVRIDVPSGGHVNVANSYSCLNGAHCVENIVSEDYKATFQAIPADGYVFVEWAKGQKHLFGGEKNASVELDVSKSNGDSVIQSIVSSNETFFLSPVFALSGYDTEPQGLPAILQLDCNSCNGPKTIDWTSPIRQESSINIYGGEWIDSDEFSLATFLIYANEYDYKLENLSALVGGVDGVARFQGVEEGQILRKGEHKVFHLVTKVPDSALGIRQVEVKYQFSIAGTSAVFDITLDTYVGDRCPSC